MHIHPDILGKDCPNEYKTTNEKALQDINSYMESIDQGLVYKEKTIEVYISLDTNEGKENKDKDLKDLNAKEIFKHKSTAKKHKNIYKKISFSLDGISANSLVTQSARLSFQLK